MTEQTKQLMIETIEEVESDLNEALEFLKGAIKLDSENLSIEPSMKVVDELKKTLDYIDVLKNKG